MSEIEDCLARLVPEGRIVGMAGMADEIRVVVTTPSFVHRAFPSYLVKELLAQC